MRLIVLEKSTLLTEITCGEEAVYLGSHERCEIRLPNPGLAPQVGVIYAEDEDVWVFEQLEEHEQVQLNGAVVTEKVALKSGDQLKIQDYIIRAEADHVQAPEPAAKPVSYTHLRAHET